MQMSAGSNLLFMLQQKDETSQTPNQPKQKLMRNFNFKMLNFDEIDRIIEEDDEAIPL